jgi:hypothetical protein
MRREARKRRCFTNAESSAVSPRLLVLFWRNPTSCIEAPDDLSAALADLSCAGNSGRDGPT